ncbi:2Fe-2S iron-sulfur cluster-binding protein [Microbacterium sp. 2FI]|uniref:2Fe-2S iron-sulfur cluster-binding protein n=1 Tax=Microbacterium sp. 2FI TaxID=2502193 RepID=UPI00201726BE|nr:2Fe-2S iron-sulfur cluster-binding protein [Microbacterium sp. 2FI]
MSGESITVTFTESDGATIRGEVEIGNSLMRAAQILNVPGIIAECGGMAACSTCHCYVDREWLDRLRPMDDMEAGMLEIAIDPDDRSRLSCQITLQSDLDGLTVSVPRDQA